MKVLVDDRVYELAEDFIEDFDRIECDLNGMAIEVHTKKLAEIIQNAIEDYLGSI